MVKIAIYSCYLDNNNNGYASDDINNKDADNDDCQFASTSRIKMKAREDCASQDDSRHLSWRLIDKLAHYNANYTGQMSGSPITSLANVITHSDKRPLKVLDWKLDDAWRWPLEVRTAPGNLRAACK